MAKKKTKAKPPDPFGSIEELDQLEATLDLLEFGKTVTSTEFAKLVVSYTKVLMLGEEVPPLDEGASSIDEQVDSFARQLAEMVIETATSVRDEEVTLEGKTLIEVLGERPKFQLTPEQLKAVEGKMLRVEIDEEDFHAWLKG